VAATEPDDFILQARVARLATVDGDGRPSLVPICFAVHHGVLYSPLDRKPKRRPVHELQRVRNILINPQVAVLVDRYEEDWGRLRYALLRGAASLLLAESPEHAAAIRCLTEKYDQYNRMNIERAPMIRVDIHQITVWPENS
jgi:PPOX class probable F420-dependent enzyme